MKSPKSSNQALQKQVNAICREIGEIRRKHVAYTIIDGRLKKIFISVEDGVRLYMEKHGYKSEIRLAQYSDYIHGFIARAADEVAKIIKESKRAGNKMSIRDIARSVISRFKNKDGSSHVNDDLLYYDVMRNLSPRGTATWKRMCRERRMYHFIQPVLTGFVFPRNPKRVKATKNPVSKTKAKRKTRKKVWVQPELFA